MRHLPCRLLQLGELIPPHIVSYTYSPLPFPRHFYAKWCKYFLGEQKENPLAVARSLYHEKIHRDIRGSTLLRSGLDRAGAMSLFTYLFCFLLSFVYC